MPVRFHGLPSATVTALKARGTDAYGLPFDRMTSDGDGWPCRHCLGETPHGETVLVLAHRPFTGLNAYTETGPIFLCEGDCPARAPSGEVPAILRSPSYLVRGYSADERIVYGTGGVVATEAIAERAEAILRDPQVAFVDVRSAANNCFQCRITRA